MNIEYIKRKILSREEETVILNRPCFGRVIVETTYLPDYYELIRRRWTCITEYRYEDESVCGGVFEAPATYLSFPNIPKGERETSEEVKQILRAKMKELKNTPCLFGDD